MNVEYKETFRKLSEKRKKKLKPFRKWKNVTRGLENMKYHYKEVMRLAVNSLKLVLS